MDVELRHLRYFVAVAEEASFTAASRRVHVAQQVLSAQVRQLEDILGVALLERRSRGVVPTVAGEAFLAGARETLRRLERTIGSTRALADGNTLRVGLSVAAGGEISTALLARFERAHPEMEVRLRTFDLAHPAAGLPDASTDVAIVRPPVDAEGIELRRVGSEGRVVVLPIGHRLAGASALTMADLRGEAWVAAAAAVDGCTPDAWRDDWLGLSGDEAAGDEAAGDEAAGDEAAGGDAGHPGGRQQPQVIGAVASSIDEWREHVAAGRGVSICPASAERYYARPDLTFVPALGVPDAELCIAWRRDDPNPLVARFVELAATEGLPPRPAVEGRPA